MLQEIKIKNFLSFKEETTFSFLASNDMFAEESQVVRVNDDTRLLRFAIIYGYNASGKTNLVKALGYLTRFWSHDSKDMDSPTGVVPFKLDRVAPDKPSGFELVFYVEATKYLYQLELDSRQVYLEKLAYYEASAPVMLFERTLKDGQSDIRFNPEAEKISDAAKELIIANCVRNTSFFVARNKVNVNLPLIDKAKDWLRNRIMRIISPNTQLTAYAERHISEDKELNRYIVDFLQGADFNITDIISDTSSRQLSEKEIRMLTELIDDEDMELLKKDHTIKQIHTEFEHTVENENGKETYMLDKKHESTGTLRTFGLETAIYNALKSDSLLPIDEWETSLHPKLLEMMLFHYLRTDSRSQLIVTTHNDGLLDLLDDLIRKDSVWFTEKKKSGVTELYKLTDFRGLNRIASIREAYRNKRFGATIGSVR